MNYRRFFISILFLLYSFSTQATSFQCLSQIPNQDKESIEKLLSYLLFDEGFAYVLFGSKPLSTIGHDKTTPTSYKELYPHPMFELEAWWKIWEKYSHFFPTKDYLFFSQETDNWFEVFLMNKSNCLKVIEENLPLFRERINHNLGPAEILDHLVSSPDIFRVGLNKSQGLLGILLGYGKKNSIGFENYFSKNRRTLLPEPSDSSKFWKYKIIS